MLHCRIPALWAEPARPICGEIAMLNHDGKGRDADPAPHKTGEKPEPGERESSPPVADGHEPVTAPEPKSVTSTGSGFGSFES